jgi:hypothetical protein
MTPTTMLAPTGQKHPQGEYPADDDDPSVLLFFLGDGRFCSLEANLTVRTVTERLSD